MLTFNLITIWFALGALGSFITAYITNDITIQCLVFTLLSIVALVLTRPFVKRALKHHPHIKTNLDSVIGEVGIVEVEINEHNNGRITVLGKDWKASSNRRIKVGEKALVLSIEGVKLIVKKLEGK
jgi:membrane protein implicated in regulation of membrane protease activity